MTTSTHLFFSFCRLVLFRSMQKFLSGAGTAAVVAITVWAGNPASASESLHPFWEERAPLSLEGFPPVILRQTGNQTVLNGDRVVFFAETAGEADLSFQWTHDDVEIPGAIGPRLLLPEPAAPEHQGTYRLLVSNQYDSIVSEPMQLVVTIPAALPIGPNGRAVIGGGRSVSYDLYLPPDYDPEGAPLPLLLTYAPGGGGMVSHFQQAARELQIIVVGVTDSRNGVDWRDLIGLQHETEQELRNRVNYDATTVFAAGFSGGGLASFNLAKRRHPHIAGVLSMGGWLGNQRTSMDRYQPGLIVARTFGETDTAALHYLNSDGNFLLSRGAIINDWIHAGGHVAAPYATQMQALQWMLNQRDLKPRDDRALARLTAARWRAEGTAGRADEIMSEILDVLMTNPRSWLAQEARRLCEELFNQTDPANRVHSLARTGDDLAADYLFAFAFGAGRSGSWAQAQAALRIHEGLLDTVGDRFSGFAEIETHFGRGMLPQHVTYTDWLDEWTEGVDSSGTLPGADLTGDGVSILAAYAMGLDPTANNAQEGRPRLAVEVVDERRLVTFEFRQSLTAFGVSHSIEYSRDLLIWLPLDARPVLDEQEGIVRVKVQIPLPATGDPFFLRHRTSSSDYFDHQ